MTGLELDQKNIILYGAGYCGTLFLELLQKSGKTPIGFFDNSEKKIGQMIMGKPVWKPCHSDKFEKNVTIIVCLFQIGAIYNDIRKNLELLGYTDILHIYELRDNRELFRGQNLIISPDLLLINNNIGKIHDIMPLLEDNLSRITLQTIIEFLIKDIQTKIPALPIEQQYFAYDLYKKIEKESVIDCGAFKGVVMDIFLKNNSNHYNSYYAIEPDAHYTKILKEKKKRCQDNRIKIYEYALSNECHPVFLRNYADENSVLIEDGEMEVECIKLDSLMDTIKPTFIKIDVEGYERKLLEGAKIGIMKYKPLIAIAIYHHEQDLWELPYMVHEMLPEHKLFIRSYMNVQETILYAVPCDRLVKEAL